jgi:hypothetical protein
VDTHLRPQPLRWLIGLAAMLVIAAAGVFLWDRYAERHAVTEPEGGGAPVTQIISARLAGASALKVAELSGTVQSTASDIRGLGWLRSDQVVKMPYSVAYFVDVGRLRAQDLQWNAETRTLIVDAPDVAVARPNTDEGRRTLVRTTGLIVTRRAAEELARRTSIHATAAAEREASSPERLAQAREHARSAIATLLARPLAAAGLGNARVVVTFPTERNANRVERWDTTRTVDQVLANER